MLAASEFGGEVATLLRAEPDGSVTRVRVWIVDLDHQSWIEHGDGKAFWLTRLASSSEITRIRDGTKRSYIAVSDIDAHDTYHRLREEQYGLADKIVDIGSFGFSAKGSCQGVPVRLTRK